MRELSDIDILHENCPGMSDWLWQIEADADGWYLKQGGRRRTRRPWRPNDAVEAFAVATLLFMLNNAGPVPLPKAVREEIKNRPHHSEQTIRLSFEVRAYSLLLRHLIR